MIISKPIMSGSHSSIMVWKLASRSSEADGSLSPLDWSASAEGAEASMLESGATTDTAAASESLAVAILSPSGASAANFMGEATAAARSSRDNRFFAADVVGTVASSRRDTSTVK